LRARAAAARRFDSPRPNERDVGKIFDGMYCQILSDMGISGRQVGGRHIRLGNVLYGNIRTMSLIWHIIHIRPDIVFSGKLPKDYFHRGPHS
jgi:hypothetical protein